MRAETLRRSRLVAGAAVLLMLAAAGLPAQQSRVFATSTVQNGALGGLAGADGICSARASAGGLGGAWVAWLSTSTVNAVDRLSPGSGPFVRASDPGTVIATNVADLTDGTLQNPILLTESGVSIDTFVWTGTSHFGALFTAAPACASSPANGCTCDNWTSASALGDGIRGSHGDANLVNSSWTDNAVSLTCETLQTLYCFEVFPVAPAAPPPALALLAVLLLAGGAYLCGKRLRAG